MLVLCRFVDNFKIRLSSIQFFQVFTFLFKKNVLVLVTTPSLIAIAVVGAAWIAGQDRSMWRTLRPSAGQAQQ